MACPPAPQAAGMAKEVVARAEERFFSRFFRKAWMARLAAFSLLRSLLSMGRRPGRGSAIEVAYRRKEVLLLQLAGIAAAEVPVSSAGKLCFLLGGCREAASPFAAPPALKDEAGMPAGKRSARCGLA